MNSSNLPCLPLIVERHITTIRDKMKLKYDWPEVELHLFPQSWGSTALGFGGIGGQAMTIAYTTVVCDNQEGYYSVFFGEKLAYSLTNPNQKFFEDMYKEQMEPVYTIGIYKREVCTNEQN